MTVKNSDFHIDKGFPEKRDRQGRRYGPIMREALKIIAKYPKIGSSELRRLLFEGGHQVSEDYAKKLRKRARGFLSPQGELCPPISVPPPEAKVQTSKTEEKELETSPVSPITFTQPRPQPTERGTELTTGVLEGVSEDSSEGLSRLEPHGGKFGVELPSQFYFWLRQTWDLYPWMLKYQRMKGFEDEPWLSGCYFGVSFVVIPPTPKHDGRTFLIWSIPRPASIKEYRLAFLRMQGFAGECGFEFHEQDVELVQELHYAERGVNRFGFREPIKVSFAGDGGYVVFDRSMDLDETEYSDVDTFLELTTSKVGADMAQRILEKLEGMDERLKALETAKDMEIRASKVGTSLAPAKPVYEKFLPSSWEREREGPAARQPGPKRAEYIVCPLGLSELEPRCQARYCRFSCRLWRFEK